MLLQLMQTLILTPILLMKRKRLILLPACFCLLSLLSGCTDNDDSAAAEEIVPVRLFARGGALEGVSEGSPQGGVTRTEPGVAFTASVAFSSERGEYTSLDGPCEGIWTADVAAPASGSTEGGVIWRTEGGATAAPVYPRYGDYLYLVAYAPVQSSPTDGTVAYTLTGQEDLLYVKELQGNKRDGNRFSGNTQSASDKPLVFNHLLTRLSFKARKKQADGLTVKITKVTVNGAQTQATVPLATGEPLFATPADGSMGLSLIPAGGGVDVAGTSDVEVGNLMLPPVTDPEDYTLTIETSVGNYNNVRIDYGEANASQLLRPGVSHEVVLSVGDHELSVLSVTVEPWKSVQVDGDLDIGGRD